MAIRVKNYKKEDLEGKELVCIDFRDWSRNAKPGTYRVHPVEIVKVTAKQFVINTNRVNHHWTAEKFGVADWGGLVCPKDEVEEVIKEYKEIKLDQLEHQLDNIKREIEITTNLKENVINGDEN